MSWPLPGVGTATGFGGRWADDETFFSYTSLVTPADILRLDLKSGEEHACSSAPRRPSTPTQFETRRAFVTSKDGTRFPVFIGHTKGLKLDGSNPTLLYGYGGFNVPTTPGFNVTAATWMQMGGVYVTAAIRGGGEYGRAWHEAGTKLQKQNVFDDFIAAAEWLIAQKITSPAKLAVNGGSNGGLLVGAVVNQRPELFGAAVPAVGVMDMLRFHKFTIGWAWISDYGSSDDAEQFKALQAYSPLHNIRSRQEVPAGAGDDRRPRRPRRARAQLQVHRRAAGRRHRRGAQAHPHRDQCRPRRGQAHQQDHRRARRHAGLHGPHLGHEGGRGRALMRAQRVH